MIAQLPSSLAPFALLNRLLPQGVEKLALRLAFPEKTQEIGYKAYYDKCRYSEFRTAADKLGSRWNIICQVFPRVTIFPSVFHFTGFRAALTSCAFSWNEGHGVV